MLGPHGVPEHCQVFQLFLAKGRQHKCPLQNGGVKGHCQFFRKHFRCLGSRLVDIEGGAERDEASISVTGLWVEYGGARYGARVRMEDERA